jgi:tetratricopeptide (TPR) repeat protein
MTTRPYVAAVVLVVLLCAAVGAEVVRDAVYGEPRTAGSALYVRSGEFLKRASLSNAALLADVYWIRAIQYYGGTRRSKEAGKSYELLYPLLDIVTTLDAKFSIAYRFGAVFLAEPYPGGPGRPDLSIALLEKGIRLDPSKWQYFHDLGFVYYWSLHDFRKAAESFRRGGAVPGAPVWMEQLAAVTYGKGGDRQTSRALWQQLYQAADNEWLRNNAALRLTQLDALDQIDQLEKIVAECSEKSAACVVDSLFKAAAEHSAGVETFDDQTVVAIRVRGGSPTSSKKK